MMNNHFSNPLISPARACQHMPVRQKVSTQMVLLALCVAMAGCAVAPMQPVSLNIPQRADTSVTSTVNADPALASATATPKAITTTANPVPPGTPQKPQAPMTPLVTAGGAADITLNFDQLPLPAFIQAVYAQALKKNISIDPAVTARKDLVTLRSGKPLTAAEAESSARLLLKTYGISVQDIGGLLRVVPDNTNIGYLPEIRRGSALPETPMPLRPVFQLVELNAVRNTDISNYLRTLYGEKVKVTDDPTRNAFLLSGNGDDVQAALEAIAVLDQPLFKSRNSIRITPTIWSAEELTKRLTEILVQEGYSVGTGSSGGVQYPITLLPVAGINSIIVFTQSKEVSDHIVQWAKVLDKPAERSVGRTFFSYQVRNTDASRLAETVQRLLGSAPVRVSTTAPATGAAAATTAASNVVVDKPTNTILFRATGEEYTDIIRLLNDLDRSARQVLIDVTIFEVELNDGLTTGVDWIFSRLNSTGRNTVGSGANTTGVIPGNALSSLAGLVVSQLDGVGNPRVVLNAVANDGKTDVLSNPKILVRNGESANIQVGTAIPILTQQQTNSATGGNGIISSVQYADTGTIMNVKAIIHSSDQVDMEIKQEVSTPGQIPSGGGPQSPPINKRALDTKLTLKHGSTYVLGGLISSRREVTGKGVPFLKDIPILGRAFKTDKLTNNRTELVMMITPYIISDDGEARAVSDAVKKQLGNASGLNNSDNIALPR
jgi:general secretion pathway protein D